MAGGEEEAAAAPPLGRAESEVEEPMHISGLRTVAEIVEEDAEDESLRRYKEKLLGSAAVANASKLKGEPVVTVHNITLKHDGRKDIIIRLATPEEREEASKQEVVVKEGATFLTRIEFSVENNITPGLHLSLRVCNSLGITMASDKYMLGSRAPNDPEKPHVWESEVGEHAKGFFSRGKYTYKCRLLDDLGNKFLRIDFPFVIASEWPKEGSDPTADDVTAAAGGGGKQA